MQAGIFLVINIQVAAINMPTGVKIALRVKYCLLILFIRVLLKVPVVTTTVKDHPNEFRNISHI